MTSLRCFQSLSDRPGNAVPPLGFRFELFPSRLGQAVVFRAAVIFRVSPERRNPTFFFHAVQGGKREPGLTIKVPPVICWIRREIPNPCISPTINDFKISRSKVPCKRLVCSELKEASYRLSIGRVRAFL